MAREVKTANTAVLGALAALLALALVASSGYLLQYSALPNPVDPQIRAIDRLLDSLSTGNIAFNAPSTMRVDDTYAVHLLPLLSG